MHTGCNSSPNSFHHVEIGPQPLLNCHDAVILSRRRSWSSTSSKHQAASIKQQAASERTIKRNTTHPSIISTSKQSKHQVLLSLLSLDLIKLGRRQPLLSIRLDSCFVTDLFVSVVSEDSSTMRSDRAQTAKDGRKRSKKSHHRRSPTTRTSGFKSSAIVSPVATAPKALLPETPLSTPPTEQKVYAVKLGHQRGTYTSW